MTERDIFLTAPDLPVPRSLTQPVTLNGDPAADVFR